MRATVALLCCRDKPEDIGFPPVEGVDIKTDKKVCTHGYWWPGTASTCMVAWATSGEPWAGSFAARFLVPWCSADTGMQWMREGLVVCGCCVQDKPKPDIWAALVNNVLKNPFIWGMALTYFFIYVVRQVGSGAP